MSLNYLFVLLVLSQQLDQVLSDLSMSISVSVYLRYIYTKPRYIYIYTPNPVIGLASPEMEA